MPLEIAQNQFTLATPADLPEWIELLPTGPAVKGIDGRQWLNDSPDRIIAHFNERGRPLVVDWEHATEHRAPNGLDAPAAGWVDRLEIRVGAIWGHVKEWTQRARQQLADKAYRFISPVFQYEKNTGRIVALTSAALTNSPNLTLVALNQANPIASLTAEERRAAYLMGISEADWLRTKPADFNSARNAAQIESQLSAEERRVCKLMGVNPSSFVAQKQDLS
jgi:phage I-like protein